MESVMEEKLCLGDAEEVGRLLFEAHPEENPLDVEPEELRRMVGELGGMAGPPSPEPADVERLEAIRMEWFSHYSAGNC
jgi:Fe-S-cluster formation regulator IscX/YfhJ